MKRVFFGKISKKFPIQLEQNFYAAGPKDSSWYGGIEEEDYVFPIYQGKVSKLWRVISFDQTPNPVNSEGRVNFEIVKEYTEPIPLVAKFVRYKNFDLDLNLLNKSIKSTVKVGFFPIPTTDSCPSPENIDFDESRNIFIALKQTFQDISFKEGDLRVLVEGKKATEIKEIQILKSGKFERYDTLHTLYLEKNKPEERYDLTKLLEFAIKDHATNKEKYLRAVIDGIRKKGYFKVNSPIKLYDNILVGRKKTKRRTTSSTVPDPEMEEYDEYQDYIELLKFSPNLILYGPPGTGKTYSVEKIIEAFEYDRTGELEHVWRPNHSKIVKKRKSVLNLGTYNKTPSYGRTIRRIDRLPVGSY